MGQRHLIEAKRGKQLNVMAALLSTGEVFSAKYWETTTADIFGGFLGLLTQHVGKPIKLIIDNASIHRAKALKPVIEHLKMQGLTIYFFPPYSPELNKIERLWHKIKHTWMTPKYRDSKTLEADVEEPGGPTLKEFLSKIEKVRRSVRMHSQDGARGYFEFIQNFFK